MNSLRLISGSTGRWPVTLGGSPKVYAKVWATGVLPNKTICQGSPTFARRRGQSGMLLLEAMLAVLIFSLAAVALATALNESLDAFADIRRTSIIRLQLQSAMAEVTGQELTLGKAKLELGDGSVIYSSEVTALELQNEEKQPVPNLYQVVVRADWQEGDRKMHREATQYVYKQ